MDNNGWGRPVDNEAKKNTRTSATRSRSRTKTKTKKNPTRMRAPSLSPWDLPDGCRKVSPESVLAFFQKNSPGQQNRVREPSFSSSTSSAASIVSTENHQGSSLPSLPTISFPGWTTTTQKEHRLANDPNYYYHHVAGCSPIYQRVGRTMIEVVPPKPDGEIGPPIRDDVSPRPAFETVRPRVDAHLYANQRFGQQDYGHGHGHYGQGHGQGHGQRRNQDQQGQQATQIQPHWTTYLGTGGWSPNLFWQQQQQVQEEKIQTPQKRNERARQLVGKTWWLPTTSNVLSETVASNASRNLIRFVCTGHPQPLHSPPTALATPPIWSVAAGATLGFLAGGPVGALVGCGAVAAGYCLGSSPPPP